MNTTPNKIKNLALLKLRRPPDGRERRQLHLVGPVHRPHPQHHRPMFLRHRKQVIDHFEISRLDALARFLDRLLDHLLHAIHSFCNLTCHFNFFGDLFVQLVHSGHVGKEIKRQFRVVAQKLRHIKRGLRAEAAASAAPPGRGSAQSPPPRPAPPLQSPP